MHTASSAWEGGYHRERSCAWGKGKWSGWEIAAIAAGFLAFWPVGLLALFWKMKKGELWKGSAEGETPWAPFKGKGKSMAEHFKAWSNVSDVLRTNSGNQAFEEYKAAELAKLDEMRRRLEEDQKAFAEFMERVRRAKDKEEFERFMAERATAPQTPQN
jgi:hypothetical protein